MLGKRAKKSECRKTPDSLSLAIVGRPNAGKSSLVNKLLNHERMIVDNQPGTTRDAIDSTLVHNGLQVRLIDTAGLRKKTQVHNDIEYYCNLRALNSIRQCDICVLLIDTAEKMGEQDLKILSQVLRHKKGMIICWNKWDLIVKDHKTFDQMVAEARKTYREAQFIPMLSISALTGQRVGTVLETAITIQKKMTTRIPAAELRDTFFSWTKSHPHPFISSGDVRFLGFKQIADRIPHFVCFCSNGENIVASYKRYLLNKIYETYDFAGCPVALNFKPAGQSAKIQFRAPDFILEKE
jgi:GTP-binding protein